MKSVAVVQTIKSLTLGRILMIALAGGFAGLMMDIRVEHVEAVHENRIAWVPIFYSAFMAVASTIAFVGWTRRSRIVISCFFLLAVGVGAIGFYFHNNGNVKKVITNSIRAWVDPKMEHSEGPPMVAPLAFVGLGMIGTLAALHSLSKK